MPQERCTITSGLEGDSLSNRKRNVINYYWLLEPTLKAGEGYRREVRAFQVDETAWTTYEEWWMIQLRLEHMESVKNLKQLGLEKNCLTPV